MALASERRLVRGSDVRELGLSPQLLIKLHNEGRLQRVSRGVYSLPDAPVTIGMDVTLEARGVGGWSRWMTLAASRASTA